MAIQFFDPGSPPSAGYVTARTNPDSPLCPFNAYVGNRRAVRRLCRSAAAALMDSTLR